MNSQQFIQALKRPDLLDQSTLPGLKEMIDNYPFFPLARILYLRNLKNINSYKFEQELTRHAVFIPDRAALYRFLCYPTKVDEGFELLPYDEETFSQLFDDETPRSEEAPVDELDYSSAEIFSLIDEPLGEILDIEAEEPDLIEKFIQDVNPPTFKSDTPSKQGKDLSEKSNLIGEELITETLAKVYLRQGLYSEALESYQKLILKFPEKNSYFAGQIENIKKLISKES